MKDLMLTAATSVLVEHNAGRDVAPSRLTWATAYLDKTACLGLMCHKREVCAVHRMDVGGERDERICVPGRENPVPIVFHAPQNGGSDGKEAG